MAYRVGSVVQQPIKSYGEVTAEAEDQQLQAQDRQLRALTLQEAVEQRRAKAAEAQAKAQKEQARQAFLKEAATKYRHENGRPDLDAIGEAAFAFDPEWGSSIIKDIQSGRKTAADTEKLNFEHGAMVDQASSNLLRASLKNPALYPEARKRIVSLDPKADQHLPPEFDPAVLTQFADLADASHVKAKGDIKAVDMLEQGRIDDYVGWRLSHAKSQEDVNAVYDDLTANYDAPTVQTVQRTWGTQFGPDFAANVAATQASRQTQKASTDKPPTLGSFEDYVVRKFGPDPTPQQIEQARKAYNQADDRPAATGSGTDPLPQLSIDPNSQNILSQTGLSINAFRLLTGQGSQLPRDQATRNRAANEAQKWARDHNVDIATLPSQYQSYNKVLGSNIERLNNTKVMESELLGTIDNLQSVVKDADLGRLNIANVAKIWAGQEVNDSVAQQYALHLGQLRNELSAYYAATQGRTGNNITEQDQRDAANTIKNGLAAGSLKGLKKAIENSTEKMGTVMQGSVDRAQKQVWSLFGVGANYKTPEGAGRSGGPGSDTRVPDFIWDAKAGKSVPNPAKKGG